MDGNSVYFIWGDEPFLVDSEINRIVHEVRSRTGEEPELLYLDADDLSAAELQEILEFSPLFSLQRVIILKRPFWLQKGGHKKETAGQVCEILNNCLRRDNSGQTLILTSNEYNSGNPVVKLLAEEAEVIHCKALSKQKLLDWVEEELTSRSCSFEREVARLLAWSGKDMYYLENLIDKLCLTVKERPIGKKDIAEHLDSNNDIKIFKLTDALLNKDLKASFQAYHRLLIQGEQPGFFLYMIVRQLVSLAKVKYFLEKGLKKGEIADSTGMMEFLIGKMMKCCRLFTWKEIQELFAKLLQADIDFKTSGKDEKIIFETLIIEICSPK